MLKQIFILIMNLCWQIGCIFFLIIILTLLLGGEISINFLGDTDTFKTQGLIPYLFSFIN